MRSRQPFSAHLQRRMTRWRLLLGLGDAPTVPAAIKGGIAEARRGPHRRLKACVLDPYRHTGEPR
jgi:hypothetical protein